MTPAASSPPPPKARPSASACRPSGAPTDAAVAALARRLPEGVFDLPACPSAHDRLAAGAFLDAETLAELRQGWRFACALRFVRRGPAIAVLRLLPERRPVPCLLALAP